LRISAVKILFIAAETVDIENVRTRRLIKNAQKRTDAKYLNDYFVEKGVEKSGKSLINAGETPVNP
jgi:hypothetical protein